MGEHLLFEEDGSRLCFFLFLFFVNQCPLNDLATYVRGPSHLNCRAFSFSSWSMSARDRRLVSPLKQKEDVLLMLNWYRSGTVNSK